MSGIKVNHLMGRGEFSAQNVERFTLPSRSVQSVMREYLTDAGELTIRKMISQKLGYLCLKEFCSQHVPQMLVLFNFYDQIRAYEKLGSDEARRPLARGIYQRFIMPELLSFPEAFTQSVISEIQYCLHQHRYPQNLFQPLVSDICQALSRQTFNRFLNSKYFTRFCQWKNVQLSIHLGVDDFRIEAPMHRHSFGKNYKCQKVDTGKIYRMKCYSKKYLKLKGAAGLALNEQKVLTILSEEDCPFIVQMTYTFQTDDMLYYILDYTAGGDLQTLTKDNHLLETEARFYTAEIILGLEHMHKHSIVYRDLKPSNILLNRSGHIRIADTHLACDFSKTLPTATVGSHGYVAPEVLEDGTAYNSSADWFSLGCLLYHLIEGHSPFYQKKSEENRKYGRRTVTTSLELPHNYTPELVSLLNGLLDRVVNQRLGCSSKGALEVKSHQFFRKVIWHSLYMQEYVPPQIPVREKLADSSLPTEDMESRRVSLVRSDEELYWNFAVTMPERWASEVVDTIFWDVNEAADQAETAEALRPSDSDGLAGTESDLWSLAGLLLGP
ncbi:beta-adrenergic receptor kinase 1-like [Stegostoma tigrinum]|uniref:beta-adrenergic receptor kinase 1-like n=1 Tax=Stegostoma tigrinum TaxID=3053191 RepID=UPI00286FF5AC|nr:beta-adrenergic receptor kinase 1-like [Stegostoma tigrinum]